MNENVGSLIVIIFVSAVLVAIGVLVNVNYRGGYEKGLKAGIEYQLNQEKHEAQSMAVDMAKRQILTEGYTGDVHADIFSDYKGDPNAYCVRITVGDKTREYIYQDGLQLKEVYDLYSHTSTVEVTIGNDYEMTFSVDSVVADPPKQHNFFEYHW